MSSFFPSGMGIGGISGFKGAYDSTRQYRRGETVTYSGNSYICIQGVKGIDPTNSSYWDIFASGGAASTAIDDTNTNTTTSTLSASKIVDLVDNKINDVDSTSTTTTYSASKIESLISTVGGSNFTIEDLANGEAISLIDTTPPDDVLSASIYSSNVQTNSITINWSQSSSSDVNQYQIYKDASLLDTVAKPYSPYQSCTYTANGLTPSTVYNFKIKTVDTNNNISVGTSYSTKTMGTQALSFNGSTDYLKLPSLTFTTIEFKFSLNLPSTPSSNISILDARNGVSLGYFERTTANGDNIGTSWSSVYVNDVIKTSSPLSNNVAYVMKFNLSSSATDDINIFSNLLGNQKATGNIYYVKIYNNGSLVAFYDLTSQFSGTSVVDSSGNNSNSATLFGSPTWVAG